MSAYLLVHGGFGVGWVWDDVAKRLEGAGHRAHVVDQLPSVGTNPASLGDLSADACYVRRTLDPMDEPIVLWATRMAGWSSPSWPTTRTCGTVFMSPPFDRNVASRIS